MKHAKDERGVALALELVILAIILTAAGYAGYQYFSHKNDANPAITPKPHIVKTSPSLNSESETDWLAYKSNYEGMSFRYPPSWKLAVSTQQVQGWTDVDTVTVTSTTGFKITFFAHVQGLGGACSANGCPYVQTVSREQMPHITGAYFLEREIRNADNKTLVSREIGIKAITDPKNPYEVMPTIGTTQEFPYYLLFPSRGKDKALASFIGSYPDGSTQLLLPIASYFELPDVLTGKKIIESSTY